MPQQEINLVLNDALKNFSLWLKSSQWRGKEHDCVNLFAHEFLFERMTTSVIKMHPAQICIESGLEQPIKGNYINKMVRKDLVIWGEKYQNSWSEDWKPVHIPLAVMDWKAFFRKKIPNRIFDSHDEKWIRLYTEDHIDCVGYIVSVDLFSSPRKVYWKHSRKGVFSQQVCI